MEDFVGVVYLERDPVRGWLVNGLTTGNPPALSQEEVEQDIARRICDNPSVQSRLGILGAKTFRFRLKGDT